MEVATESENVGSPSLAYESAQLLFDDFDSTLQEEMYLRDHNLSTGGNASQLSSAGASPNFQWPSVTEPEEAAVEEDSPWRPTASEVSTASNQQDVPKAYRKAPPIDDLALGPKLTFNLQREPGEHMLGSVEGSGHLENAETLQNERALEEKLCKMISTARSIGFESLDSMMLQYYTLPIRENISLPEVQSRSRQRGLPNLLSLLSNDLLAWPQRESQGTVEALLASIEHVIRREAQTYAVEHSSKDRGEYTELPKGSEMAVEELRVDVSN